MPLFICKLPNDPGQFCSRSLVLRGEEEKHVTVEERLDQDVLEGLSGLKLKKLREEDLT